MLNGITHLHLLNALLSGRDRGSGYSETICMLNGITHLHLLNALLSERDLA